MKQKFKDKILSVLDKDGMDAIVIKDIVKCKSINYLEKILFELVAEEKISLKNKKYSIMA
jgi:hypothetical protein